jgi:hypothetical protein
MFGRFKGARPSPALVISLVALFVSLGGVGFAAVTITGKNVKNSSLTGKDVKNSSLTGSDVKNSSLTGSDIKNNKLTGSDVLESSLGKVPSAGRADSAGTADNATNAGNANALGGRAANRYKSLDATLPSGQTEEGIFAGGGGASAYINLQIQFDPPLTANLDEGHMVEVTGASATHCSGVGNADPGYFCLYEKAKSGASFTNFGNPVAASTGADRRGTNIFYSTTGANAYVYGAWALTAP